MLEQMRRSSQSLLIYVLFGIVIAVFIINFGPQSRGGSCEQAMGGNEHYAAKVAGEPITTNDFRYGFMLAGGAQVPAKYAKQERLKEMVMDRLIERELLAAEGERLGYVVTEDEAVDQIGEAKMIGLGALHTVPRMQKDGKFNYDAFKSFVQLELGMTPKSFIEEQKKEILALRVRDLLRDSVTVSPDEVKADFLRKQRQVNLEYMRFSGHRYEGEIAPTDAEIADYAAKNEAKLKEAYEQKKFAYEKVPPQRRLRQILIKVPKDAKPEVEKAARTKAEALTERLKKGAKAGGKEGLTFTELARTASDDAASKAKGGDLGWRARGATNLSGAAEDKVWNAKPGALVGPLRGNDGFVITKMEGAREGEVSFEKAKLELAEEKVREEQANARAKASAEATVAKAKETPQTPLKTLFPPPSDAEESSPTQPGSEAGARAAGRGDRPVLAARDPRGCRGRGDRRIDGRRQGGVRAHPGGAAGGAVRGRGQLRRGPAQGAQGSRPRRARAAQAGARPGGRAGEVGAGPRRLDARALPGGKGGEAHHGQHGRPALRGQQRAPVLRGLRRPPRCRRVGNRDDRPGDGPRPGGRSGALDGRAARARPGGRRARRGGVAAR